jgi:hypothetical protein
MNESQLNFQAEQVTVENSNGVYIVAFAARSNSDPDKYVILQRSMGEGSGPEGDACYLEVSNFGRRYDEIAKATLSKNKLSLELDSHLDGLREINIIYNLDANKQADLESQLERIFKNTRCKFVKI